MSDIACFLLVPTGRGRLFLRRYADGRCSNGMGYHDAQVLIGEVDDAHSRGRQREPSTVQHDPRWPAHCTCGYKFRDEDAWQERTEELYRRSDSGELVTQRDASVGAMWWSPWLAANPRFRGEDGNCLTVRTPGGDWTIDGQASNCDRRDDHVHKCWCRHGQAPAITVDKVGNTCGAGGGSILMPGYHGWLRGGVLSDC